MATNVITGRIDLAVNNEGLKESFSETYTVNQTNQESFGGTFDVTTSDTVVDFGDIAAADLGLIALINLDDTNYVDFGPENGGAIDGCMRLQPGEPQKIRLVPSKTYRWQADTDTCKVKILALGN